jgi:hypothetical protein
MSITVVQGRRKLITTRIIENSPYARRELIDDMKMNEYMKMNG